MRGQRSPGTASDSGHKAARLTIRVRVRPLQSSLQAVTWQSRRLGSSRDSEICGPWLGPRPRPRLRLRLRLRLGPQERLPLLGPVISTVPRTVLNY